jgi:hypothetical protein
MVASPSVAVVARRRSVRRAADVRPRGGVDSSRPRRRQVFLGPLSAPVRFTDCDDLLEHVRAILRGWSIDERPGGPRPVVRLTRTRRGYRRVSRWRSRPSLAREKVRETVVGALCGFHFELIDWYAEEHPEQLCLHAAAAVLGDGLVVFPSVQKAGKSVLTVALAERGVRVFTDDVLPIHLATRRGIALGIVPRLRVPLPENATPRFRKFVAAHRGPGHRRRQYVALPDAVMAPLGATAPVRRIVLLERVAAGPARLEPLDPADALEALLLQNFTWSAGAPAVLEALHAIARDASCHRLVFARSDDAAALLQRDFAARTGGLETAR